jgi:hypothetical protein
VRRWLREVGAYLHSRLGVAAATPNSVGNPSASSVGQRVRASVLTQCSADNLACYPLSVWTRYATNIAQ